MEGACWIQFAPGGGNYLQGIVRGEPPPKLESPIRFEGAIYMPRQGGWSRDQLIVALKLYCELPFGKMHSRNPEIIRYAHLIGRTPSALAMKLTNFASLDPEIRGNGRKGLSGASRQDKEIWEEMTSNWLQLAEEVRRIDTTTRVEGSATADVDSEAASYEGRTKSTVVETRLGQGFFRQAVLSSYGFKCCVSGLSVPELLIASHIVPWRADKANRLNPRNGLCLSAIHDRAFDQGLLTISEDMCVVLSKKLKQIKSASFVDSTFRVYDGQPIHLPLKFFPDAEFLNHHRTCIFEG